MQRKKPMSLAVDEETAEIVRQVAERECEGNRSQAARRLIKFGALVMRASEADTARARRETR